MAALAWPKRSGEMGLDVCYRSDTILHCNRPHVEQDPIDSPRCWEVEADGATLRSGASGWAVRRPLQESLPNSSANGTSFRARTGLDACDALFFFSPC